MATGITRFVMAELLPSVSAVNQTAQATGGSVKLWNSVLAPQGLRQLIQCLVIVMKMLRVKPKGVSRWVAAGLCWDLDYLQYSGNRSSRWFCLGQGCPFWGRSLQWQELSL